MKRRGRLTHTERKKIVRMHGDHVSVQDIATVLNRSTRAVSKVLKSEGVVNLDVSRDRMLNRLRALYEGGMSLSALGRRYGRSTVWVTSRLEETDADIRPPGRIDPDRVGGSWRMVHAEEGQEDWLHSRTGHNCTVEKRGEGWVVVDPPMTGTVKDTKKEVLDWFLSSVTSSGGLYWSLVE